MIAAGVPVKVDVFHHCSVPNKNIINNPYLSVDIFKYKIAQDKDIEIKKLERRLKLIAVDCQINKKKNLFLIEDGSRDCEYTNCDYNCMGITNTSPEVLDYSTSNLYYYKTEFNDIVNSIKDIFGLYFYRTKNEIMNDIIDSREYIIVKVLSEFINNNIVIVGPYGQIGFLREYKNIFFTVPKMTDKSDIYLSFYVSNPSLTLRTDFETQLYNIEELLAITSLEHILIENKTISIPDLVSSLSIIQRKILLKIILYDKVNNSIRYMDNKNVFDAYLKYFKNSIIETETDYVLFFDVLPKTGNIECISKLTRHWSTCNVEDIKITSTNEENIKRLNENPFKIYGIYNEATDKFLIKEFVSDERKQKDTRKDTTGRVCSTYEMIKLVNILIRLDIKVPDKKAHFLENNVTRKMVLSSLYNDPKAARFYKVDNLDELKELSTDKLINIYNWTRVAKQLMCDTLHEWFMDNNLLLTL